MITHHPDVPLGQHIDIDGHHYVISVLTWPLSSLVTTRAYRAEEDGTVRYGQCVAELDRNDPDEIVRQLTARHACEGAAS